MSLPAVALTFYLVLANSVRGADTLKIEPAHALPDYTKLSLQTNTNPEYLSLGLVLACGDFNEDGRMDAACLLQMSSYPRARGIRIQLQGADGTVSTKADYPLANTYVIWEFRVADFNEDGHLDLLVPDLGNDLILMEGNGDGTFQAPHFLGLAASVFPVPADFNGDHHPDLVAGAQDGWVAVFAGHGDGTFTRQTTLYTAINANQPRRGQVMVGDVNRDGKPDVAVAAAINTSGDGSLDVYVGNGDGTFQGVIRTTNVAVWKGALGDFNGDGILDFAGDRQSPKQVEIWLGRGDGTFAKRVAYPLTFDVADVVQVADLNGDGILDLALSGEAPDMTAAPLSIFLGNGNGTFQPRQEFTPLNGALIYNAGPRLVDFNGDGHVDIVSMPIFWETTNPSVFGPIVFGVALNQGVKSAPNLGALVKVQNDPPAATGPLVLEASPNLVNWTPLATNTGAFANWPIVDASVTNQVQRFYRTRR